MKILWKKSIGVGFDGYINQRRVLKIRLIEGDFKVIFVSSSNPIIARGDTLEEAKVNATRRLTSMNGVKYE